MIQAASLEAIHDERGAFLPIVVGGGKTLLSLLAPVILESKRPLLIIPAALREKTKRDARMYAKDWQIARNLSLLTYEKLSVVGGLKVLDQLEPDVIICDEAHAIKNTGGPRARRIKRYMRDHPETVFVAMSATFMNRTMDDYWHIIRWCLPRTAPLPFAMNDYIEWREALDQNVQIRRDPGILVNIHPAAEGETPLVKARDAFARRLAETPGVVVSRDKGPGMALTIRAITPEINREKIEPAVRQLRDFWRVPDGTPYDTALEHWRHTGEVINCGLWYRWNPPAPYEWLEKRLEWSRFCRAKCGGRGTIDTPGQLANAIVSGRIDDGGIYAAWKAMEPTFIPNPEAVWIDDALVHFAAEWLRKHRGLCWVDHREFGNRLEEVSGVPYFTNGGLDRRGLPIESHKGAAILSLQSNRLGRNLQAWHRNLIMYHPPNGRLWEQTLGRTHREGQKADEVIFEIPIISIEQWKEMCKAREDAGYIQEMTKQPQKLMYATWDIPDTEEVERRAVSDYLWRE